MPLAIRTLDAGSVAAWDAFVLAHPRATFFHRAGWAQAIERAFGQRTHFIFAERDGAIAGVLPLGSVRSRLFGHSLISVPFCVHGGPLGDEPATEAALLAAAERIMDQTSAPVLELRLLHDLDPAVFAAGAWPARDDLYVTFRKRFTNSDEANLKAIPRKQRAMVRKGIDRGLTSDVSRDAGGLHRIYAESVRNLGTPVFPRRWFQALLDTFGENAEIVTIRDGDNPVAAVMNFTFRDEILPYYGGGTSAARHTHANDFMYWEVMRRAAGRGLSLFDFGRSKRGTGAFAFKKNWGFEPEPIVHRYRLAPGAAIPDLNPLNPKYRLFIAAWKKLPLPLANLLGPAIVRGLG
ncbi:MAG: FemAB family PEP-CTERM system-associated protein [Rhodospirillales bacterium]|nr:FemAB family PEP-CTERM system-associated protein [Rhodospirillales bacterium]